MNKDLLRQRIRNVLFLSIPIVMPFVNERVLGASKDGNHWGGILAVVMIFLIWLPAAAVLLGLSLWEAALRQRGKTKKAAIVGISNLFTPVATYAACIYLLLNQ